MQKFKEMKFWIGDDPELSELIQGLLFYAGYRWYDNPTTPQKMKGRALYTDLDGKLGWSDNRNWFDESNNEEIDISWATSKREVVDLAGKRYYKDELEKALENINPI